VPAILVRKLSEKTHRALKLRAQQHGNSTEAEVRLILDMATEPEEKAAVNLAVLLQEFGRKYGPIPEIKRDKRPSEPATLE
jgi:plasmid stability protein